MMKLNRVRIAVPVVLAAVVILAVGGIATASNMGFKINKPMFSGGAGNIGKNLVSIPYNNPYGNAGALCTQTGLPGGLGQTAVTSLNDASPTSGFVTATCGTAAANAMILQPGKAYQIRPPAAWPNGQGIIIVGSHNPTLTVNVPALGAVSPNGKFWFSVPYHTTALTASNLCTQAGLKSTGLPLATITRHDANSATTFITGTCGQASGNNLNLVLGEGVQINQPTTAVSFIPAHF